MPSPAEDGEWSNWCSNVVCVRTKSSKEPENSSGGPVIHVQPILVRSTYREEPQSQRVNQRRRITRLIQSPPLSSSTSPIQYEGVGRVSLSLKAPSSVSSSTYNGPSSSIEYSRPPLFPSRMRSPVRVVLRRPVENHRLYHLIPDNSPSSFSSSSSSSLLPFSGRDLRPSYTRPSLSSSYVRASSLPPSLSTGHVRRSSVATVPSYSTATSGYGGRSIGSNTGSVTSSSLRRGSVDVSYLSSGLDNTKSPSYSRYSVPPVRSEVGLPRSNYRRGSLSVPRPTYRSSSVGRLMEDELKSSVPLSSTSETISSLRARTQKAKDKLDTQRSLLDRYLPGGSRESSIDTRFDHLKDTSVSRRSSISSLSRPLTGSRAPSIERSNDLSSTAALHRAPPTPTAKDMSPARRRIRNVLYKVSGDEEFLN